MTDLHTAAKQALEALENHAPLTGKNAITALREALAEQPAPMIRGDIRDGLVDDEPPVAWKHDCAALLTNDVELWIDRCPHCGKPRTSPPVQRNPQPAPVQQEQSNKSLWMDCTALADAIHYPACWDTGAYPELDDALHELAAWFKVSGCTTCAAQPAQQEPVDFTSLLREAEEIVQGKPTWKRFIDGTPLSNDIAVWMTVFAQDVARRTSPQPTQPKQPAYRAVKTFHEGKPVYVAEQPAQQERQSMALNAAMGYIMRHTPKLVHDEICKALRRPVTGASTQPAQRKPLTIREIGAVCGNFSNDTIKIVRQIEAKHGIKENK